MSAYRIICLTWRVAVTVMHVCVQNRLFDVESGPNCCICRCAELLVYLLVVESGPKCCICLLTESFV